MSFKDEVTLSLRGRKGVTGHEGDSTFDVAGEPILKSAVIYGANASGKSNLIKAMRFMKHFVLNSAIGEQSEAKIDVDHFKLTIETVNQPSQFEITFVHEDRYYRYGFELNSKNISQEWLYQAAVNSEQETFLFHRKNQSVKFDESFEEIKSFIEVQEKKEEFKRLKLVRETALLLSVVAQFDGEISRKLMRWFTNELSLLFANEEKTFKEVSEEALDDVISKEKTLDFLKIADTGIEDIRLNKLRIVISDSDMSGILLRRVFTSHNIYDSDGKVKGKTEWSMYSNESEGTQKLFALSAPIIDALEHGKTLVIDELDSKLHPVMMRFILNLFNSAEKNPKNAQLIFNSHDANLLSKRFFRRDQIWFTEKDEYGATNLYSLADFKDLTEEEIDNETFKKDYFQGRYGAVPFTGDFSVFGKEGDENASKA
ncbi:MAG: ATP-binding protein [Thiotrichaceae bacterium]